MANQRGTTQPEGGILPCDDMRPQPGEHDKVYDGYPHNSSDVCVCVRVCVSGLIFTAMSWRQTASVARGCSYSRLDEGDSTAPKAIVVPL